MFGFFVLLNAMKCDCGSIFVRYLHYKIWSVVLKRVALGSPREEFLIPGRKCVSGRNWGGKSCGSI